MKTNNETNSCAFFVSNEQVESVEFIDRKNSPYGYTWFYCYALLGNTGRNCSNDSYRVFDKWTNGYPKWLVGLIGLFLLFFLSFQFTAIIGAGKVKGVVEDITGLSNTVSGKVDWNNIETTYPVLKPYLDKVGTKVDEVSDQKTSALSDRKSVV